MDLLLDVNVVLDIAAARVPHVHVSSAAIAKARREGCRVWLYSGSVQTLQYCLTNELRRARPAVGTAGSWAQAKDILCAFSAECHWLAALSGEAEGVFAEEDPEDGQLVRAVKRLGDGARLLTRDTDLLATHPECTVSPEVFLGEEPAPTSVPFIDLAAQQDLLRPGLERRLHTVLHHGKYILGPEVSELEADLAAFVGSKHCVGCSSGTDALLLGLMAYGVGPRDAVFTTPFSFIATAEVIALCGATPVFVDIDPVTYNIAPGKLREAVTQIKEAGQLVPRCIIPVDLFGLPADYDEVRAVADEHGLFVLQDAAQAFGAEYKGRRAPSLGGIGATSFFPAKPLGGYGDGGAVFTDDDELAGRMRSILVHGKGTDKYNNVRVGLNARLDTLQAAILLEKMRVYRDEIDARQRVAASYDEALSGIDGLQVPQVPAHSTSVWAQYSIQAGNRAGIQAKLKQAGIPSAVYYVRPLHLLQAFDYLGYSDGDFPVAESVSERIFSLPFHPYLERETVSRIADAIRRAVTAEG